MVVLHRSPPVFSIHLPAMMFTQLSLDEAIALQPVFETVEHVLQRVENNANEAWKDKAYQIVQRLCATRADFTTDEIWEELKKTDEHTHEPRAIGAIVMRAARARLCEPTDRYKKSTRPECHRRPIQVWKSLSIGRAA
jgi:hypothetical protein